MSGHLNPGGQQFRGDRGAADPRVTAALAAYQAGQGSEQAALSALASARLLVPVVATLAEGSGPADASRGDKNSEMALPTLIGRDGRPALLAFTGLDALARWRPDARPVPAGIQLPGHSRTLRHALLQVVSAWVSPAPRGK